MFERFIMLAKARKALQAGRIEEALQLTAAPGIRDDRRAEEIRSGALQQLVARARRRADGGDLSLALEDLQQVLQTSPGHGEAQELERQCRGRQDEGRAAVAATREAAARARRLAEQGQLDAAGSAAPPDGAGAEVRRLIADRRRRAEAHAAAAQLRLTEGEVEAAMAEYRNALALDAGLATRWSARRDLCEAAGRRLDRELARCLDQGEIDAAVQAWRQGCVRLPELADTVDAGPLLRALRGRLLDAAETGELAAALRAILALDPPPGGKVAAAWRELASAARHLQELAVMESRGATVAAAEDLVRAVRHLGSGALLTRAEQIERRAREGAARLDRARQLAGQGDLAQARAELVRIVQEWPMHEQARKELQLIDQGARDREQRLAAARNAAREGRLREACGQALALVVPGPVGEEPRLLVTEVRARMDLVAKGIDQVKVSLAGRDSGSMEGVRHCLLRLQELVKVQTDHEELPGLLAALGTELETLERCEACSRHLAEGRPTEAAQAIQQVIADRTELWSPGRLDARLLTLADGLLQATEGELEAGRLDALEACLLALDQMAAVEARFGERAAALRARASARRQEAAALVAQARQQTASREIAQAHDTLEQAFRCWTTVPEGRRLAEELAVVRQQDEALARVEALAAEKDFVAAQRRLADLPPTPMALRTRIFDLKQELARAQGLEGPFLLRVDEGGEFLVLRRETVTIGNVRDGGADLPILASLAGRHARIERMLSFHGGMEDRLVAQDGELEVNGARTTSHRLRSGDRVRLGRALQLEYNVPSARSLTAALTLAGGFQVGGTERILLMKDRGRDGRILIGSARDVHVRVAGASGEVEVFTTRTGQVRVRAPGSGLIDGRPFSGEHPVDAGAVVQCAGVSFVLLPWSRGR